VTPEAPAAFHRLRQQNPCPLFETVVARGLGDQVGQLAHDLNLFGPVERALIGENLNANVIGVAVHIRECAARKFMHEGRGVLAEHRNVRHLLDRFDGGGGVFCQRVRVAKGACGGVDINHRHRRRSLTWILLGN
jgi:hypothetical protein